MKGNQWARLLAYVTGLVNRTESDCTPGSGRPESEGPPRPRNPGGAAGLRRSEVADLTMQHLQQREEHWVIADLIGKATHIRTVPVPGWVKVAIDGWTTAAEITTGPLFRCISRRGTIWGEGITEKVIWHVVKESAAKAGIAKLSPHDCRRTCARLCHTAGGELEQIQFLLGHVSVETTERYLGCKQRLRGAVNDKIGLEP